jgi:Flp pilus assembly protein TadG
MSAALAINGSAGGFLRRLLRRLLGDVRGAAILELAVGMSVLVPIISASTELARFVMIQQKLERLAATVGDLNARGDVLTPAQVTALFDAVPHIMDPFTFAPVGKVIVSQVTTVGYVYPQIAWQQSGGGNLIAASTVGTAGHTATLPAGFTMATNQNLILTEVYYDFSPFLLDGLLKAKRIHMMSTYRPRM